MKVFRFYLLSFAVLLLLDAIVPHPAKSMLLRGGITISASVNPNSCGVSNNNWCVGTDGWTVFTANNATGTCPGTDAGTGPCFATADNSTDATFQGTVSGATGTTATLTINSGSNPSVGESVILNGSVLGTITAGTAPTFTMSTTASNQGPEAMTSSPGNDATCGLIPPPTAVYLSTSLSSLAPATGKACYTQLAAFNKLRLINPKTFNPTITATISGNLMQVTNWTGPDLIYVGAVLQSGFAANTVVTGFISGTFGQTGFYTVSISQSTTTATTTAKLSRVLATRDWLLTKKGTNWSGSIGGNSNYNANGWSPVDLNVITTYGVGTRPNFVAVDQAQAECFHAQQLRGYQIAVVGFACANPFQDPASPSYATYTVTADAGATICGSATLICNTTVPADVQANPSHYRAFATGINTVFATAATPTTVTLASAVGDPTTVGTGRMKIQFTNITVGGGMSWLEFDTLIVEDNLIRYAAIGPENTSGVATDIPFARIRRNIMLNQYTANNFGGDNVFTGFSQFGGSYVFEENLMVAGGWVPATWGAYGDSHSHNMYMHNPSSPDNLYSNINAYNSADNQYRDGGTAYNNLFLYQSAGGSLTTAIQDNPTTISYNVNQNAYNIPVGTRTAPSTPCSGTGVGCNSLKFDGAITQLIGSAIADLTNPNAIVGCVIDNATIDATDITLVTSTATHAACNIAAGNRGNGVQAGDILRVYQNGGTGVLVQPIGKFISAQPGGATSYFAFTKVSVSAASPSVITDTVARSAGEPFSFTPVVLITGGSGYGANIIGGTLTGTGNCTVSPVINVNTNAVGNIVAYTGTVTPGTCTGNPTAWTPGGGLSAGTGVSINYAFNMGTLPTGVSLGTASGGACTGSLVANPNTGVTVCTYYALANGTSYQFSATSGGAPINASGTAGSNLQRTGTALWSFAIPNETIFTTGAPAGVVAGISAYIDLNANPGFPGPNGGTTVQSISSDRNTVITDDASVNTVNGVEQFTMMWGIPTPCSIFPSCYTATVGPNNLFIHSEVLNASYAYAIEFNRLASGYVATGNYVSDWNSTLANNTIDSGFSGTNTLNSGGVCSTVACPLNQWNDSVAAFPKASIEYYDASQLETGNTFSGYIDNGAGSAGFILTITSGTPPTLVAPTNVNYGVGDTIFDIAATTVKQATRIVQQIDATHYYVSVSQLAGSSGSPLSMMYGSTDRFIAKAATQSHDTGWNYAYTAEAANDFIRSNLSCGNQVLFPGSPACPAQGQSIH